MSQGILDETEKLPSQEEQAEIRNMWLGGALQKFEEEKRKETG